MSIKNNHRRNPRASCAAPARAEGPRGPVKGVCRNVSVGGFFFLGPPLLVGRTLDFDIELPTGPVKCVGEVRYLHNYPEGPGCGVRFTRLGQEDLARVQTFLSKQLG